MGVGRRNVGDPHVPFVYDLVADRLGAETERLVRAFIKSAIDAHNEWAEDDGTLINAANCPTWRQGQTTNLAANSYSKWAAWPYAIGYDERIEWFLYHRKRRGTLRDRGGMSEWITRHVLDLYDLSVHQSFVPEMDFHGSNEANMYTGWTGASLLGQDGKLPK